MASMVEWWTLDTLPEPQEPQPTNLCTGPGQLQPGLDGAPFGGLDRYARLG